MAPVLAIPGMVADGFPIGRSFDPVGEILKPIATGPSLVHFLEKEKEMAQVLVVEDNRASLDLMVYLLKAYGHAPVIARDGLEGIDAARREHPDLILCDIQLPSADGVEVCRQLKKDPSLRDIPLVAVTAYAMVGDRERILAAGCNGYIEKPIDPDTFVEELAAFL